MQLSRSELDKFNLGGPHDNINTIRLQVIKGHADYYDVADWTSHVDSSLSMGENLDRMAQIGDPAMGDMRRRMADSGSDHANASGDPS